MLFCEQTPFCSARIHAHSSLSSPNWPRKDSTRRRPRFVSPFAPAPLADTRDAHRHRLIMNEPAMAKLARLQPGRRRGPPWRGLQSRPPSLCAARRAAGNWKNRGQLDVDGGDEWVLDGTRDGVPLLLSVSGARYDTAKCREIDRGDEERKTGQGTSALLLPSAN